MARVNASRLLAKASVSAYLESKLKFMIEKIEITAEMVLREDAAIAFSDVRKLFKG